MVLTQQQIELAHQLRSEGYTIRDMEREMGISRMYVSEALKRPLAIVPPSHPVVYNHTPNPQQQTLLDQRTHFNDEAYRIAEWNAQLLRQSTPFGITSPEHIKELQELTRQTAALAADRADLERREAELKAQLQTQPNEREQYEMFRHRSRQDKLVRRYNRLIQELLDNCDDLRWTGDEVDDFLQLAEAVRTSVQQYCDANAIDERRLLIYNGLSFIIDEISEMQDDQTSGFFASSSVDFDFGDEYQAKLKSYMVDRFEQESPRDLMVRKPVFDPNYDAAENDDDETDEDED